MLEKDKNQDGKINLDEYLDHLADDQKSEWYMVEKNRFEDEYDKDRNGVLEGPEIGSWLVMNLNTIAAEVCSIFKYLLNLGFGWHGFCGFATFILPNTSNLRFSIIGKEIILLFKIIQVQNREKNNQLMLISKGKLFSM